MIGRTLSMKYNWLLNNRLYQDFVRIVEAVNAEIRCFLVETWRGIKEKIIEFF
jgi:hypothetical protein